MPPDPCSYEQAKLAQEVLVLMNKVLGIALEQHARGQAPFPASLVEGVACLRHYIDALSATGAAVPAEPLDFHVDSIGH